MRVLIACGGTAGHIFPGLALAEELKSQDNRSEIVLVVSGHRRDKQYLEVAGPFLKELQIETVPSIPLPYNFSLKYVLFAVMLLQAFLKSFIIILRYRPEVVVGFGGYASFAPLIIARIIDIPTLIHEQNFRPGRANRVLARIVDRIAVSFNDTNRFFLRLSLRDKIVNTGLPLRKHILDYKNDRPDRSAAAAEKFNILVVGGSQGAHNINELVLNCLRLMDETERRQMHLIHLTGKRDFSYVQKNYQAMGVDAHVFDFLKDIASVYRIADLLIARSGASTIFEAASFGLPSIFIPYCSGTADQKENALYLERLGAAIVLNEQTSSGEDLKKILQKLTGNKTIRDNLAQRIKALEASRANHNLREQLLILSRAQ